MCSSLKTKFERELQTQWQRDSLKDCDLYSCHKEKKNYKALYELYKAIIEEMKQTSWCQTCIEGLNIDANELKLAELEKRLRTYK